MNTLVSNIRLAATLTAVSCSRVFTSHTLRQWQVPALIDDAEIVVSELVTNSIRATGVMSTQPTWSELEGLRMVHVSLFGHGHSVTIQVWDASKKPPFKSAAGQDPMAEQGRGLFIVEALAHRVGHFYPQTGGKVVWAELALKGDDPPLPRIVPEKPMNILLEYPDTVLLTTMIEFLYN